MHQTPIYFPVFGDNTAELDTFDFLRGIIGWRNQCKQTRLEEDCPIGLTQNYMQGVITSSDAT